MKKLPAFTLIHSSKPIGTPRPGAPPTRTRGIRAALRKGLSRTAALAGPGALAKVTKDLRRRARVETVGIWDLGAWVGGLPHIIQALNTAQPVVTFFEVQAAVPMGLQSSPEKLLAFAAKRFNRSPTSVEREDAVTAVLDEDFFPRAEIVRHDLGIDLLVGILPSALAGQAKTKSGQRTIYFDFFSANLGRTSAVSVAGLRELSSQAQRPFEMTVGYVVVEATLVALEGNERLVFHDETRGCLFDFNEDRKTIVTGLVTPHIEKSCLELMRPRYRSAAQAMVAALASYRAPAPQRAR